MSDGHKNEDERTLLAALEHLTTLELRLCDGRAHFGPEALRAYNKLKSRRLMPELPEGFYYPLAAVEGSGHACRITICDISSQLCRTESGDPVTAAWECLKNLKTVIQIKGVVPHAK